MVFVNFFFWGGEQKLPQAPWLHALLNS